MAADQALGGWPVWQVMLAEIVVGMYDGRRQQGRNPSRNVQAAIDAMPADLLRLARGQNVHRALRDEEPATGPRFVGTVPELARPDGYPGGSSRKRRAERQAGL